MINLRLTKEIPMYNLNNIRYYYRCREMINLKKVCRYRTNVIIADMVNKNCNNIFVGSQHNKGASVQTNVIQVKERQAIHHPQPKQLIHQKHLFYTY